MENKYSFIIGLQKSFKNVLITVGIPAVIVLADNYTQWIPESWLPIVVPLISIISYLIKNKITFNK